MALFTHADAALSCRRTPQCSCKDRHGCAASTAPTPSLGILDIAAAAAAAAVVAALTPLAVRGARDDHSVGSGIC